MSTACPGESNPPTRYSHPTSVRIRKKGYFIGVPDGAPLSIQLQGQQPAYCKRSIGTGNDAGMLLS